MIIFGLGNPGSTYSSTRHNAGYRVIARCARHFKKRFRKKSQYQVATIKIFSKEIFLVKPLCWMNRSGIAIKRYMEETYDNFMIIIDDVNLPLGRMRLRNQGSHGGHNGLRSIIEEMGTSAFPRLRIGIGHQGDDLADYVLSRFTRSEKKVFDQVIEKAVEGLIILFTKGIQKAQNFVNSVDLGEK